MNIIQLEYQRTVDASSDMSGGVDQIQRAIEELNRTAQTLESGWEGPAARAYLLRIRFMTDRLSREKKDLEMCIVNIMNTAKTIKNSDEQAAGLVNTAGGGGFR